MSTFEQWQNGVLVVLFVSLSLLAGAFGGLMVLIAVGLAAEFLFGAGAAFEDLGLLACVIGAGSIGVQGIGKVVRLDFGRKEEGGPVLSDGTGGPRLEEGGLKKEDREKKEAERLERARQWARERGHLKEP